MFDCKTNFAAPMRKLITRFIFAPCILLLVCYCHQGAKAAQDCTYSALIFKDSAVNAINGDTQNIKCIVSCEETTFKFEIAEIEEDKFSSRKRYLKGNYFFTILFSNQTSGHFFGYANSRVSSAKLNSEFSSKFYSVTFQVFRI